jgi:hypothetical protein
MDNVAAIVDRGYKPIADHGYMEYNRRMQQTPTSTPPKPPLPTALIQMAVFFALLGWVGFAALVLFTLPFLFPRWLVYFSLFLAFTGTALPVVWYLNRRFSAGRFPSEGVLLREALEAATLVVFLIWLQSGRMFTPFLGWTFFAAFLAVEMLLRIYERSRWSPTPLKNEIPTGAEPPDGAPLSPEDDSPDA